MNLRPCARYNICKTMIPTRWPDGTSKSETDYAKAIYCGVSCGARGREEVRNRPPRLNKTPMQRERYEPNLDLANQWCVRGENA